VCKFGGKPKNFRRSFNRLREKTVGSKNAKIKSCASPSYPHFSGLMFVRMTRRQTRAYGVAIPSRRQPLLAAMLRAFCWLVFNVVSMFRTIFNRPTRDWHTDDAHEDQFPTPNDPTQKEAHTFEPSFSGKAAGRIPGIPVASTQGTTTHSPCATNQDAWDKPKHDSVIVLQTGSGPSAAFPAQARVRNGAEGAIWSGGPNRVTEAASYARGLQTPHNVRTRNPSALRALTGPPPSRGARVATCALLSPVIPGEDAQRSFDAACGVAQNELRPGTRSNTGRSLLTQPLATGSRALRASGTMSRAPTA
jgi:hypothetical protein